MDLVCWQFISAKATKLLVSSLFQLNPKNSSSICFLQKKTAFAFPTKTTQELWTSPQGHHPGWNVLNITENSVISHCECVITPHDIIWF